MTKAKKKKTKDSDIEPGKRKLSLRGFLKKIEKLIDLAANFIEPGSEIKKEGEIDLIQLFDKGEFKEGMKGIYGFSIRGCVAGKPVVETFGNIKKTPEGLVVKEESEPLTDMFDEENEIVIIAEIPGADDEGVTVNLKGDVLEISAAGRRGGYYKEVLLPAKLRPGTLKHSCKNGVLDIRIKKMSVYNRTFTPGLKKILFGKNQL